MIDSLDAVVCPLPYPTTIAIMDKSTIKDIVNIIVYQVMDDAIRKLCCKYLPLHRIMNDECCAVSWRIGAITQCIIQV